MKAIAHAGPQKLVSHDAAAVYDSADGRVLHVHHFVVIEGGAPLDEEARGALALETARQHGHDAQLSVVHVDGSTVARGRQRVVDGSLFTE
jgi:hypothetical protein